METNQNPNNGEIIWRWFANTPDWDGVGEPPHGGRYYDGDTVTILLARDNNDKVVFRVDGVTVFTLDKSWFNYTATQRRNTSRRIIASFQALGVTPPLAPWQVIHNQVYASEMKYKNSSDTWVSMKDANKVKLEHRPINVDPNPNLIDYNVDKSYMSSAVVYASLKL